MLHLVYVKPELQVHVLEVKLIVPLLENVMVLEVLVWDVQLETYSLQTEVVYAQ